MKRHERSNWLLTVNVMLRGGKGTRSREMKRHEGRKELNAESMMLERRERLKEPGNEEAREKQLASDRKSDAERSASKRKHRDVEKEKILAWEAHLQHTLKHVLGYSGTNSHKTWTTLCDHAGESQFLSHPTFQQWWEDLRRNKIGCNSSH
jgi:hypothetical protein